MADFNDDSSGLTIQDRPWKVWMTNDPTTSAVLTNLYDLIFNNKDKLYYDNSSEIDPSKPPHGLDLGHNIILFNSLLYSIEGSLISDAKMTLFHKEGIDINIPLYDLRNRPKEVKSQINQYSYTFKLPDEKATIFSRNTVDFYQSKTRSGSYFRNYSQEETVAALAPFYVGITTGERASSAKKSTIILTSPDPVFEASLVLDASKSSFTQVFINIFDTLSTQGGKKKTSLDLIEQCLSNLAESPVSFGSSTDDRRNNFIKWATNIETAPIAKEILKHCFVWIRASFAADYIDPDDFNQDLNQEANVIHRNLYIKETGADFNRYEDSDKRVSESRGYIPKNAPLKDLVSGDIIAPLVGIDDELSVKMDKIIANASEDNTRIGSTLAEPISKENAQSASYKESLTPPQFFDPDTRYTSKEEKIALGRLPTILPKDGNITTEGRIYSPTIDELWYMIKKLISGRPSDNTSSEEIKQTDFGVFKGKEKNLNEEDTSLYEPTNTYNFQYYDPRTKQKVDKVGDPVDFDYDKNSVGDLINLKVTNFFSQPNESKFIDYKDILKIEALLKSFDKEDNPIEAYEKINIDGITANTGKKDPWTVRERPLSLRELESRILSNKYNIVKVYSNLITATAKAGPLGKVDTENDVQSAAGTLYYLHKDYNYKNEDPNTYFKYKGNSKQGTDIVVGDNTSDESNIKLYSGKTKMSKKPILVKNYGTSEALADDPDMYYGAKVFLAADGTWREVDEHIRLPILRSKY